MKIMSTQMYHAQIQNYVPNIFVSKYLWVLEAVIFGTLLPDHPVSPRIFGMGVGILQLPYFIA